MLTRIKNDLKKGQDHGVLIVVDRGYPSIDLILTIVNLGFRLVCICREDLRQAHPMMAKSAVKKRVHQMKFQGKQSKLASLPENFLFDDAPMLGPECVVFKKSISKLLRTGAPSTYLYAHTYREHGDANAAKVLRFLEVRTDNNIEWANKHILKEYPRLSKRKACQTLWYPVACRNHNDDNDDDDEEKEEEEEEEERV